jgi:hypothetical protein
MVPLQLSIYDGNDVYVYDDSDITVEEPKIQQEADDQTIKLSDVKVVLGGSVLGTSSFRSIPRTQTFRAELKRTDTGEVLLNGAVRPDDIDHDARTDTFAVRVFDEAQRILWEALSKYCVDELGLIYYRDYGAPAPELTTRTTKTTSTDRVQGEGIISWTTSDDLQWYYTMSTLEMCLRQLDRLGEVTLSTYGLPAFVYRYTRSYTDSDGGEVESVSDVDPLIIGSGFGLMPARPADEWMRTVLTWAGSWLRVRFDDFPARGLDVSFESSRWNEPLGGSPTDLARREAADAYGERLERRTYAITYEGGVGRPSAITANSEYKVPVADADYFPSPPPALGAYAEADWSVEPPGKKTTITGNGIQILLEGQRQSRSDNVETVDVQIAGIYVKGKDTKVGQREYVYGEPVLETPIAYLSAYDTWQDSLQATQDVGDPYRPRSRSDKDPHVYAAHPLTINGRKQALHHEVIQDPSGEQYKLSNELWARNVWQGKDLKRRDEYVVEGAFVRDFDEPLAILSAEDGVRFDSERWYVRSKNLSLNDLKTDLRLRRPVKGQDRAALPPTVQTRSEWEAIDLKLDVLEDDNGDKFAAFTWGPPPSYVGRALTYDVEIEAINPDDQSVAALTIKNGIYYTTERLDVSDLSGKYRIDGTVTVYDADGNQGGTNGISKVYEL